MSSLQNVLDRIDHDLEPATDRLFDLLRIESISTDPAYRKHCADAAAWLVRDLKSIGFSAKSVKTPGHPMVVAKHHKAKGAPTVLFYGHYDVQPVDPLSLWDNPPFEPKIIKGKGGAKQIIGRGTADDKGQLMTFVEACRAWKTETGNLPLNVTILFEGEEESGSPSLIPFLKDYKNELKADVALVCDTGMWDEKTPSITTALRGLVGEEVTIHAADRDLHSGMYGSAARNPIHVLVEILAGLRDTNGKITLPGFYDGVPALPKSIKKQWSELKFSEKSFLGEIGLKIPAGEKGRSVLEMIWSRPTCEINGIYGGYTGEGFKTVIPAEASAKVSFRLVGQQNPKKVVSAFRKYVKESLPADCKASFTPEGASGAIQLDYRMPELQKAAGALKSEWGRPAVLAAMGGSIPVVGHFQSILKMQSLLVGFGLDDDRIHSPNEKYNLTSFHKGARSWARIMEALA
ncbi:dipeptidase [Salaquimonas pukyongi]|uniref:dipeptidase n=1 Tax=Salaquimonas pukyongi TaxID=2712698 RepID=UPI00096B8929|nr:dipeptidase [Salaquimonas pukyongi]